MSLLATFLAGVVALSGFGVKQNKSAPSPAEVVRYAPADFDYAFHVDLQALLPHSYEAIVKLAESAELEGTELGDGLGKAIQEAEEARRTVRGMAGFDPVTDLHSVTVFAEVGAAMPKVLAIARGKFDDAAIGRVAKQVPPVMRLARAPDGALLFGTPALVDPRTKDGWKPAKAKRGSALFRARRLLRKRPFFAFLSSPSEKARSLLERELSTSEQALLDLGLGHEFAGVFLRHDGLGWTLIARSGAGFRRARAVSRGALELMRASQYATRGLARLFFAGLESYTHMDEPKRVLEHKEALLELAMEFTGDGKFQESLRTDPKRLRVEVVATGGKLSDVLPVGALLPVGAGALFWVAGAGSPPPVPESPAQTELARPAEQASTAPARRLDVRDRYRRLRARYPRLVESAAQR